VFDWRSHIERLYASAKRYGSRSRREGRRCTRSWWDAVVKAGSRMRTSAWCDARVGDLGLDRASAPHRRSFAIVDTIQLWSPERYEKGLTAPHRRHPDQPPGSLSPRIKSLNYLSHILGEGRGHRGLAWNEVIMLDPQGYAPSERHEPVRRSPTAPSRRPPAYAGFCAAWTRDAVIEVRARRPTRLKSALTATTCTRQTRCSSTGTAADGRWAVHQSLMVRRLERQCPGPPRSSSPSASSARHPRGLTALNY